MAELEPARYEWVFCNACGRRLRRFVIAGERVGNPCPTCGNRTFVVLRALQTETAEKGAGE